MKVGTNHIMLMAENRRDWWYRRRHHLLDKTFLLLLLLTTTFEWILILYKKHSCLVLAHFFFLPWIGERLELANAHVRLPSRCWVLSFKGSVVTNVLLIIRYFLYTAETLALRHFHTKICTSSTSSDWEPE